ncbi:MAG: hypothetical protein ACYCXO_12350, partial [Candidatus Humimicrobiaceae bacterium]
AYSTSRLTSSGFLKSSVVGLLIFPISLILPFAILTALHASTLGLKWKRVKLFHKFLDKKLKFAIKLWNR